MATVYVSSFSCADDVCVFHRPDVLEQASSCGIIFIFSYQLHYPTTTSNNRYLLHNLDSPVPAHHDAHASVRQVHCGAGAARTLHVRHPAPARRARLARHALHCPHRHAQTCVQLAILLAISASYGVLIIIYRYEALISLFTSIIVQELPLL